MVILTAKLNKGKLLAALLIFSGIDRCDDPHLLRRTAGRGSACGQFACQQ